MAEAVDPSGALPTAERARAAALAAGLGAPSLRVARLERVDDFAAWVSADGRSRVGDRCALVRDARGWVAVHAPVVVERADGPMWRGLALPQGARAVTRFTLDARGEVRADAVGDPRDEAQAVASFARSGAAGAIQWVGTLAQGPVPLAVARWGALEVGEVELSGPVDDARGLLSAVNAIRRRYGLDTLRADPGLARVALERAGANLAAAAAVHVDAQGEGPVGRLEAASTRADRLGEVVALAPNPRLALARLLSSPSHRARLLDTAVDAAGVGLVRDGGVTALVMLLARHPAIAPQMQRAAD